MKNSILLLKKNVDLRYYFFAIVVSSLGDTFNDLAVLTMVYFKTRSIFGVTYVYIALYLGIFLFSPIAGYITDTVNKKLIMIITELVQACIVLGFIFIKANIFIYIGMFFIAICNICYRFSSVSLKVQILEKKDLIEFNVFMKIVSRGLKLGLPALGGVLIALIGSKNVLIIDVLSFFISALIVSKISTPNNLIQNKFHIDFKNIFSGFKDGYGYILNNPKLKLITLISFTFSFVGTIPFLLKVPFILETLKVGAEGLGVFNSVIAVGTILGSYMLLYTKAMNSLNRLLLFRFLEAIFYILLGLTTNFLIVLIIVCFSSCAKVIGNISFGTAIEVITDRDVLGRVLGFQSAIGSLLTLITLIVTSQISRYLPISTIYILSGCLGIGFLLLHLIQSVRLDRTVTVKIL